MFGHGTVTSEVTAHGRSGRHSPAVAEDFGWMGMGRRSALANEEAGIKES